MSWISLALTLAKLASAIFTYLQSRQLINAGEDKQTAKAVLVLSALTRDLKAIDERFDRMTPAEVRAEIEGQGDFRD